MDNNSSSYLGNLSSSTEDRSNSNGGDDDDDDDGSLDGAGSQRFAAAAAAADAAEDDEDDEDAWVSPPHFASSSSLHSGLRDLESSLRCPICRNLFRIPVMIAPCLHSFCSECVRRRFEIEIAGPKRKATCPECRDEVGGCGSGGSRYGFGAGGGGDYEKYMLPNRALANAVRRYGSVRAELKKNLIELESGRQRASSGSASASASASASLDKGVTGEEEKEEGEANDGEKEKSEKKRGSSEKRPVATRRKCGEKTTTVAIAEGGGKKRARAALEVESSSSSPELLTFKWRKKRTPLSYYQMKRSKLKSLLKDDGLSTKGTEQELKDRHAEYIMLYNAECDSEFPRSNKELAEEVDRREVARKKEQRNAFASGAASHAAHMKRLKQSCKTAGEAQSAGPGGEAVAITSGNDAFDSSLNNKFKLLIKDAKKKGTVKGGSFQPSLLEREESGAQMTGSEGERKESEREEKEEDEKDDDYNNADEEKEDGGGGVGGGKQKLLVDEAAYSDSGTTPACFSSEVRRAPLLMTTSSGAQPQLSTAKMHPPATTTASTTTFCPSYFYSGPPHISSSRTWSCGACTFINEKRTSSYAKCEMCGSARRLTSSDVGAEGVSEVIDC